MMLRNPVQVLLVAGLMAAPGQIFAGELADDDHRSAVFEIGTAGEWGFNEGKTSIGPSAAIEVTPIEHWLEIEAGITPLFRKGGTEWEADLVFKKPFQLSKNVEFMVGLGPQWSSTSSFGTAAHHHHQAEHHHAVGEHAEAKQHATAAHEHSELAHKHTTTAHTNSHK